MDGRKSNLTEWLTAASAIGIQSDSSPLIHRVDYDGLKVTKFRKENQFLCYAMIRNNDNLVKNIFCKEDFFEQTVMINTVERSVYNDREAEEVVKSLMLDFIRKTGIIHMKIHVFKKIFSSNSKVAVAVFIEELPS